MGVTLNPVWLCHCVSFELAAGKCPGWWNVQLAPGVGIALTSKTTSAPKGGSSAPPEQILEEREERKRREKIYPSGYLNA